MKLIKGDARPIIFECNETITGWKLRCEIWDSRGNSVKLATLNSGGSDNQILIINDSEFKVFVKKGDTTNFEDKGFIEIEADTGSLVGGEAEIITIFQDKVFFIDERIKWTDPDE